MKHTVSLTPNFYTTLSGLLVAAGTLMLSVALLVASNAPGSGAYEVSIYQAYRPLFWALLSMAICLGLISAFCALFLIKDSYRWVPGFLLIVAVNALVLSLPYLRDYAFIGQWDDVNHFSHVASILDYGSPDWDNAYPVSHVLVSAVSLISGIDAQVVITLFPAGFYLIYLANVALVAWTMDDRPAMRGLTLVLATPLVFASYGTIFRPTHFAVYMLPLLIGWLYRTRFQTSTVRDTIPFLLLLLYLPFLHPWAVVSGLTIIVAFGLASLWNASQRSGKARKPFATPLAILGITWLAWFMGFRAFNWTVPRLVNAFVAGLGGDHSLDKLAGAAQRVGVPLSRIMSLIISNYGAAVLYFILAGGAIVWVLVQLIRRNRSIPLHVLALSCFISAFAILALVSMFRDLITQSPLRLLNFAASGVPMLVGSVFYAISYGKRNRESKGIFLALGGLVILASATVLGMLSSYFAPWTGQPNHQFSYAQQAGVAFHVEMAVKDGTNIYRPFGEAVAFPAILNVQELRQLRRESKSSWQTQQIIRASSENNPDELGFEFQNPGYLWITAYEHAYYTQVWSEGGLFTPQTFQALDSSPDWHRIYTSGDMAIWRVNATQ